MKLKVVNDDEYGVAVIETKDSHFPLCLFLTDIYEQGCIDEVMGELNKCQQIEKHINLSFNASVIEVFTSFVIVSDQEDEYHWKFDLVNIKDLLNNWKKVIKKQKFPSEIGFLGELLTHKDYELLFQKKEN